MLAGSQRACPRLSMSRALTPSTKLVLPVQQWWTMRNSILRHSSRDLPAPSLTSRSVTFCDSGDSLHGRRSTFQGVARGYMGATQGRAQMSAP